MKASFRFFRIHIPFLVMLSLLLSQAFAQEVSYPYPVQYHTLHQEQKTFRMAFMDVRPAGSGNGKTAVLLHGKNFNGAYWRDVIAFLKAAGFRIIVPDQVGWGKSDFPDLHYSFHGLAANTKSLLDSLQIPKVTVIAHSMGGMLATRFTLLYPQQVEKLILENPIGLEDYRRMVPYASLNELVSNELAASYESYKTYQKSYYPEWKPVYEEWVQAQAAALKHPKFRDIAWVNAVTYQMIYEQPVCYEFDAIRVPTLLIIGQEDRTVVGKNRVPKDRVNQYGQYPTLGRETKQKIRISELVELPGVGHIPHVQALDSYQKAVMTFLKK